jgi:hypothetical protein
LLEITRELSEKAIKLFYHIQQLLELHKL